MRSKCLGDSYVLYQDFFLQKNKLTEWFVKNPDCKTAPRVDYLNTKYMKLLQECKSMEERIANMKNEYDKIGGNRKESSVNESKIVHNIRMYKDKFTNFKFVKSNL